MANATDEKTGKSIREELKSIARYVATIEKALDDEEVIDAYAVKCLSESVGNVSYVAGQHNAARMHRLYPEMMAR